MRRLIFAAVAAVAGFATSAYADTYQFDFTSSSNFPNFDLTLTTGAASNGGFVVTNITGTGSDGSTVTGPIDWYSSGNDNVIYPSGTFPIDSSGLAFNDPDLSNSELILALPGNVLELTDGFVGGDVVTVTSLVDTSASASPVPEPATLAMLATGLIGIVTLRRFAV